MSSNEDNKFAEIWKFGIHILRNFTAKEEKRLFVNITTQRPRMCGVENSTTSGVLLYF